MIAFALALLGLAWGSFVNALVWRLHEQETKKKLTKVRKKELSILYGRSMCVHCGHTLAWHDLLPVISWITLGGKCRYCRRPIGRQYPLVELLTAGLFVLSYLSWPYGFGAAGTVLFAIWLIFLTGFMALAVYDLRWMILPNKVVYPLIGLAALQVIVKMAGNGNRLAALTGALLGLLVIFGLFYALFRISGGKWIGGGDVNLALVLGLLAGSAVYGLMIIFFASVMGTLVSLPLVANRSLKAKSPIPFGPFLIAATIIVYLYGSRILVWYSRGLY